MLNNSDRLSLLLHFIATISQKLKSFINPSRYHKFYIIFFLKGPGTLHIKFYLKEGVGMGVGVEMWGGGT